MMGTASAQTGMNVPGFDEGVEFAGASAAIVVVDVAAVAERERIAAHVVAVRVVVLQCIIGVPLFHAVA